MQSLRYALVAYVRSEVGEFAERLARELHPQSVRLAAHLTLLPPRTLPGNEASALRRIEEVCGQFESFDVTLGDVHTFLPTTPTVYVNVARSGALMCALHHRLNADALECREEWPYVPHLTIAKVDTEAEALAAADIARHRWQGFRGSRIILLDQLTFVREDSLHHWVDLAPIPLGPSLVTR